MNAPWLPGMEEADRKRDLSQWFTPAWLADRLWNFVCAWPVRTVLEPSAGRGSLVAPMLRRYPPDAVTAIEADPQYLQTLRDLDELCMRLSVVGGDFMRVRPESVDVVVMNPPYEENQDIAFIERAFLWSPRVVGIFRADIFYSDSRAEFWRRHGGHMRRIVFLSDRPVFGVSAGSDGPRTNFVIIEFVAGDHWLVPTVEWWSS